MVICLVNKRLQEVAKKFASDEKGEKDKEPEKKKDENNDEAKKEK